MPVCSFAQMGTLVVRPKQKATEIVRGRMENIAVRAACLASQEFSNRPIGVITFFVEYLPILA